MALLLFSVALLEVQLWLIQRTPRSCLYNGYYFLGFFHRVCIDRVAYQAPNIALERCLIGASRAFVEGHISGD